MQYNDIAIAIDHADQKYSSSDNNVIFGVGNDKMMREFKDSQIQREISQDAVLYTICLAPSGKLMVGGTEYGNLRSFKYPSLPPDWSECVAHKSAIIKMSLTQDENYLVTVGEENAAIVWKVVGGDMRSTGYEKTTVYSDEVLITRSDLEEKNSRITELTSKLEEIRMRSEYQMRTRDTQYNEKMKIMIDDYTSGIENLKKKITGLTSEKDQLEYKHADEVAKMAEKYENMLMEMESDSNKRLMAEFERYQELMIFSQKKEDQFQDAVTRLNQQIQSILDNETTQYEIQIATMKRKLAGSAERSHGAIQEREAMIEIFENDIDKEIEDMRSSYEQSLWELKDANMKLKGESGIMKKRFSGLVKEIQDHQNDVLRVKSDLTRAVTANKDLQKDIQVRFGKWECIAPKRFVYKRNFAYTDNSGTKRFSNYPPK